MWVYIHSTAIFSVAVTPALTRSALERGIYPERAPASGGAEQRTVRACLQISSPLGA